jgi:hypothetical protein
MWFYEAPFPSLHRRRRRRRRRQFLACFFHAYKSDADLVGKI